MGGPNLEDPEPERPLARTTRLALLLFVFLLPFMQPPLPLLGYAAVAADAVWLLLAALFGLAIMTGAVRLRWHSFYWLLIAYATAMAVAAAASDEPLQSAVKLAIQLYLLSLPVIVFTLVRTELHLRALFAAWLGASTLVVAVALASVPLFYLDPDNPLLAAAINDFGTLPPGPYPRLRLTFLYASMLCNYLSVSLVLLLVAQRLGWIARRPFLLLLAGILFAVAFSLTPGLGGIFLAGGIWVWLLLAERRRLLGAIALGTGVVAAAAFVVAMAVTPILHPTAPFLVHVPGTDIVVAPAVRLLAWIESLDTFLANPWLGRGLGLPVVDVTILLPRGEMSGVTDAHNTFLNIAAQCGVVGLAALVALLIWAARRLRPFRLGNDPADVLRVGLAFAFLNAFFYQGLGGSFEDARHLWVLLGLILVASAGRRVSAARDIPT